jgi:hypothetical protein
MVGVEFSHETVLRKRMNCYVVITIFSQAVVNNFHKAKGKRSKTKGERMIADFIWKNPYTQAISLSAITVRRFPASIYDTHIFFFFGLSYLRAFVIKNIVTNSLNPIFGALGAIRLALAFHKTH